MSAAASVLGGERGGQEHMAADRRGSVLAETGRYFFSSKTRAGRQLGSRFRSPCPSCPEVIPEVTVSVCGSALAFGRTRKTGFALAPSSSSGHQF